jgi:hypothetical protein
MATLREAIKGKINELVSQSAALTAEHNEKQAVITAKISEEEARLQSLGVFLDKEVADARKGLAALFANYDTPSGKT